MRVQACATPTIPRWWPTGYVKFTLSDRIARAGFIIWLLTGSVKATPSVLVLGRAFERFNDPAIPWLWGRHLSASATPESLVSGAGV